MSKLKTPSTTIQEIFDRIKQRNTENKMEENKEGVKQQGYTQWIKKGENMFIPSEEVIMTNSVEAGLYTIKQSQNIGYYLFKESFHNDDILTFPTDDVKEVIDNVNAFWNLSGKFAEYGLSHKRGILLHGKQGTGKSSLINIIITDLIEKLNGVVLTIKSRGDLEYYAQFVPEYLRTIEPNRPIVTIIEDIDGLVKYEDSETLLLNILDGLEQMEKIVYIATTNYPEKLKARILNRPSRFDIRVEIKPPTAEVRKYYFENKLKPSDLETHDIAKWVEMSDGFTVAHLREMIVSIILYDVSLEDTIERLRGLADVPHSTDYGKDSNKSIGYKAPSVAGFATIKGS